MNKKVIVKMTPQELREFLRGEGISITDNNPKRKVVKVHRTNSGVSAANNRDRVKSMCTVDLDDFISKYSSLDEDRIYREKVLTEIFASILHERGMQEYFIKLLALHR